MAEYYLPEVDEAISGFDAKMKAHQENLDDLKAAIRGKHDPLEIADDWESRQLLRQMPDETTEN